MSDKNNLFKLTGKVQHYSWGGHSFIPDLLELTATDGQPFAEYWLGAHDNDPAMLEGDKKQALNQFISQNQQVLGKEVQSTFQRLPYLLKVLDVKDMLSIQVHPSREAAILEFEAENRLNVPLNASGRNYKDNNHKPELMVALSDFWLLHGFKHAEGIKESFRAVPEFCFMADLFQEGRYETLYCHLMEMEQEAVNTVLEPLLGRILPAYQRGELRKDSPHFWAARAALTFNQPGITDRGIFSIYLLNLVNLLPGEAIFQDAGVLHAYLEGQNIEIMANSDNVLRGGLTPKHIDVRELVKHVSFSPLTPQVIFGTRINSFEEVFISPARDFQLSRLSLKPRDIFTIHSSTAEIYLLVQGAVEISEGEVSGRQFRKGHAAVAFAGAIITLQALEDTVIFRASVPSSHPE